MRPWRRTSSRTTRSPMRTPSRTSTSPSPRKANCGDGAASAPPPVRLDRETTITEPSREQTQVLPKDESLPPPAPAQELHEADGHGPPPKLADGIDLIGRYEDSGFREAPYLARRADGQV